MIFLLLVCILPLTTQFIPPYLNIGNMQGPPFPDNQLPPHLRMQKHPLQHRGVQVSVEDSLDAGVMQAYLRSPQMEHDDVSGEEDCESLPNRTRTRPAFYQCREDTVVTLHGGAVTNLTGDDRYPVLFSQPIRIFLDVSSDAPRRYDNLGVEVTLFKRSSGWFGCGWMFLPSFGMLSNYEMCDDNPSCPLSPGRQVIEFTIDPTRLFTRLFRMIHYDLSAYQLVIRLRDNRNPFNELLCATIQMRIQL